jgi:hypothetical protein
MAMHLSQPATLQGVEPEQFLEDQSNDEQQDSAGQPKRDPINEK